jgi:hypothetical protein
LSQTAEIWQATRPGWIGRDDGRIARAVYSIKQLKHELEDGDADAKSLLKSGLRLNREEIRGGER